MTNFKQRLLAGAVPRIVTVAILGGEFDIKLLTAAQITDNDKKMKAGTEAQDSEKLNQATAQLIIDSLINDGEPVAGSVTAKELLAAYGPMQLSDARTVIIKANYASNEAMDAAKNG